MLHILASLNFNVPLGIVSFDSKFKYGVGGNTKATNTNNWNMNEANNQLQRDLWNQQKEYDYQMWKENNEYNSPVNQVQRLKDAGINPALAMSQISTGTSSSTAGGQAIPQTTPGHDENPSGEVNAQVQNIALIGKQLSDIGKQYEEMRQLQTQNNWMNIEKTLDVASKTKDNDLKEQAVDAARIANRFSARTFDARVSQQEDQANLTNRLYLNAIADGSIKEFQKDLLQYQRDVQNPQAYREKEANIKSILANIVTSRIAAIAADKNANAALQNASTNSRLADSTISVNEEQKKLIGQEFKKKVSETYGIDFANRLNDATVDSLIGKIVADCTNAQAQPLWNSLGLVGNILGGLK